MNPAPVNFLRHIYEDSINHIAIFCNAEADDDKEIIKKYLILIKEQIDEWIKEL